MNGGVTVGPCTKDGIYLRIGKIMQISQIIMRFLKISNMRTTSLFDNTLKRMPLLSPFELQVLSLNALWTSCVDKCVKCWPYNILKTWKVLIKAPSFGMEECFRTCKHTQVCQIQIQFYNTYGLIHPESLICSSRRIRIFGNLILMMTSSNGNIFRVTGPLCGEFTGHRWIPRTKASDAELWWAPE